ncbi:uncharacterized protein LOC144057489 [Vanacampus margaritifer]
MAANKLGIFANVLVTKSGDPARLWTSSIVVRLKPLAHLISSRFPTEFKSGLSGPAKTSSSKTSLLWIWKAADATRRRQTRREGGGRDGKAADAKGRRRTRREGGGRDGKAADAT